MIMLCSPKKPLGLRIFLKAISLSIIFGYVGCSHGERQFSPRAAEEIYRDTPVRIDLDISSRDLNQFLKNIRSIIGKKELNEQDITNIERLHALYSTVRKLTRNQKLSLPPNSRLKIDLPSFCLDPSGLVPSQDEPFLWRKEDSGIPYYSKLIKLISRDASLAQQDAQELIWNLRNRANYEDYPPRLSKVLDQIDSNAKLVLPSHIKSEIQDTGKGGLRDVLPEVGIAEDAFSLIEGRYYSYSEIADSLRNQVQSDAKPHRENSLFQLESNSGIYASVQSFGFSKQEVVIFNTNGTAIDVDLSEYFLKPINSEVQRIGLSIQAGLGQSSLLAIQTALKDTIIRDSAYWYAGRLTPAEMDFIKNHPIEALNAYAQSRKAILSTWKYFGRNSDDDESDAFRHFVWAGLLTQELGDELAREFLSAHEQIPTNSKQADRISSEMDQWNNAEGVKFAKTLLKKGEFSIGRIEKEAYEAIIQDRLRVLQSQGTDLIYPVNK